MGCGGSGSGDKGELARLTDSRASTSDISSASSLSGGGKYASGTLLVLFSRGSSGSVFSSESWGSDVIALTSKLCGATRPNDLDADNFTEAERDAIEVAKRTVLDVLDWRRTVEVALWDEAAAGVECTGRSSLSSSVVVWSDSVSPGTTECSNSGNEGSDDGSLSSSILRHIRDGVSYRAML